MYHAKLVRMTSGLAYSTGHNWNHLLGVRLLRDHYLIVRLLLGGPEIQTKRGHANTRRPWTKAVTSERSNSRHKGHPRSLQLCLPHACQDSNRGAHRIHLLRSTRHHRS